MLLSIATLAMMLAATGQACTRVLVEESWDSAQYMERTLTLWDDRERVESARLGAIRDSRPGIHYVGQSYSVAMDGPDKGPRDAWVRYPNGYSSALTIASDIRKYPFQGKNEQVKYCMWDNVDCGNANCGLPDA